MQGKWLIACVIAALLPGDILARGNPDVPSAEMMEFLGTFDTASGEDFFLPGQEREMKKVPADTLTE
jgi:hypothetical protein